MKNKTKRTVQIYQKRSTKNGEKTSNMLKSSTESDKKSSSGEMYKNII